MTIRELWAQLLGAFRRNQPAAEPEPVPERAPLGKPFIWCDYEWRAPAKGWPVFPAYAAELAPTSDPFIMHACEYPADVYHLDHACVCGAVAPNRPAEIRLLRLVRQDPASDDCIWPEDTPCPKHSPRKPDQKPFPAHRDCVGTCTNCNAVVNEWCAASCPHYDQEAVRRAETHERLLTAHLEYDAAELGDDVE